MVPVDHSIDIDSILLIALLPDLAVSLVGTLLAVCKASHRSTKVMLLKLQ